MKKHLLALAVSLLLAGLSLVLSLGSLGTTLAAGPPPTGTPRPVSAWDKLPPTRTVASSLSVQSTEGESFYTLDFQTYDCVQVQATLEYTGTHSLIYLDTSEAWARSLITATAQAFDAMWPSLVEAFGPPPDGDGQERFTVLLLDIRDPYYHDPNATTYIPAYFDPIDQAPGPCSNNRDMLYLDLNPTSPAGLDGRRGLAHSLVNAIGWQADPAEALWLVEALAYLGEYRVGLGHRPEVADTLANPRNSLTGHTGSSGDVGQTYLWGLYLFEQFGPTAVYSLTQSTLTGMAAVEAATGAEAATLFHQWTLANMVDEGDGSTPYGYSSLEIVSGAGDNVTTFKRPPATNVIVPLPVGYPDSPPYRRPAGLDLEGTFQGIGYHAADYYRIYPLDVPTWIVDGSAYQPFGQSIYSDSIAAAPNWTEVITVGTVSTGSSYEFCTSAARSVGALGQYRYQIWPLYPPWWPGWDDGDNDEDGDCLPDWIECPADPCQDTDGDGTPDYQDSDSDNDGLSDTCEYGSDACPVSGPARDSDDDGIPDYLDPDDDNDGLLTIDEIETGLSCDEASEVDCDRDGVPNYLDPDSDDDGRPDGSDPTLECVTDTCETCLYLPVIHKS